MTNLTRKFNKAEDIETISRDDLPSLYHIATLKSIEKKNNFYNLIKINLLLLIIGALSSSIFVAITPNNQVLNHIQLVVSWISFISLIISLFITIFIQLKKFDQEWYGARAIAESIKTLSWRFMMGSDKFGKNQTLEKVIELFTSEIKDINNQSRYLAGVLGGKIGEKPLITQLMYDVRKLSYKERLKIYLTHRIEKQKNWYLTNSKNNESNGNNYFNYIYVFQAFAILSAFLYIVKPTFIINPSALLITLATSFLTWSQVSQFKILAQSYGFTAHELNNIITLGKTINSESNLSKFVIDSEQAISREHTMWLARKIEF